ncbi:MAG: amidase [Acidobacteria bacterium]|nr:amidase [Acidobacteriota bacterium]
MATLPSDIFHASIGEINAKLKAKEFSCVELTRAFCDRLEKLGPRYNALALSMRQKALKKAKDVDGDIKIQRFRGPLQGVPFGAKDLLSVEGLPTAWGAKPYAGQTFKETATVLKKLDKTGAVLIGKLAMVELAGGPTYRFAAASSTGPGLNPWDTTLWSGGSSSGSGSAVAAGLATFALGSETSGSIITPAAFCGITGLRPTYGLVSRHGAMALSWTLDKIGPMARTAEDCALILAAIAGGDAKDQGSAGKSFYYAPQFQPPLTEVRVGFAETDFAEWPNPTAQPEFQKALEAVRALGLKLKPVKLPEFPYGPVISTVISAEAGAIFEELITSGRVDQLADAKQIAALKASLDIPAKDYLRAMRIRSLIQEAFRELFFEVDLLFAPARFGPANKAADPLDRGTGRPAPSTRGLAALIPASNLAGLPGISLPCGFAGNAPLGIQFVSRPFNENLLVHVGKAFQNATDWHRQRPRIDA